MSASSYTVSRNPDYIMSQFGTTRDCIALATNRMPLLIISNKGTGEPLTIFANRNISFGQPGRGESWGMYSGALIGAGSNSDNLYAWTQYNYMPISIDYPGAVKYIYQNYPDTYHDWVAKGIITKDMQIPPMTIPQTPQAPIAPVVGDTPFMGTPPAGLPPVSGSLTAQGVISAPLTNQAQIQIAEQAAAQHTTVNAIQNQIPSTNTSGTPTHLATDAQTPTAQQLGQTEDTTSGLKLGAYTIKGYTLLIFGLGIIAVAYAVFKGLKKRGRKLLA